MTIWEKKRQKSGLTKADVAKELGLSYVRYSAIEKGDVKMPSNLINKFNELINRGAENKLANMQNTIAADKFWEEMKKQNEFGVYVIRDKMKEFNIVNMQQLANLLGYHSCGTIYNYLQDRMTAGDEFKKRVYNFFSDENNIQIPVKIDRKRKKGQYNRQALREINVELDKYYDETDFKDILHKNNLTCVGIADYVGVHNSTISTMVNKKRKPGYDIIEKVKEYIDKYAKTTTVDRNVKLPEVELPEVKFPEIPNYEPAVEVCDLVKDTPTVEQKAEPVGVIRRYTCELNEITELLKEYNEKIKELEIRKKVCTEVLDAISQLTSGFLEE